MEHHFDPIIVNKWRKERKCFTCFSKINIWDRQEVMRSSYDRDFVEIRICIKCSEIMHKHRWRVTDCWEFNQWVIHELMSEVWVTTYKELDIYISNLQWN